MALRSARAVLATAALTLVSIPAIRTLTAMPLLPHAGERRLALEKLQVLGSVLYVGAHPDDENTALLAYLAKGRRLRTGYLSLTRGDGGQNLIGTEQGETLGAIRTQELLAARRVDGAEQWFTRAVDFGYSKTPEETLRIWGHDAVLSDIVRVIRSFRPDVIISRFPENSDGGHGHHTASAILVREAFVAAADPKRYPEQLAQMQPWQAKRLLWNAWRRDEPAPTSTLPRLVVDLGTYDPLLGQAYTELAATARSFHKSQGFGAAPRRGPVPNDFELVAGEPASADIMEGVDTTWRRVRGGDAVQKALDKALAAADEEAPHLAVPALVEALGVLDSLPPDPWLAIKRRELVAAIAAGCGLWLEATAPDPGVTPGSVLKVTATAINRSPLELRLVRLLPPLTGPDIERGIALGSNVAVATEMQVPVPSDTPLTQPYWLQRPRRGGLDEVVDPRLIGLAEAAAPLQVGFVISVAGRDVSFDVPVENRVTDPVEGERVRAVAVVPEVTVTFEAPVLVLPDAAPRPVRAMARAFLAGAVASVGLQPPPGFRVSPESVEVRFERAGDEKEVSFTLTPPAAPAAGELTAMLLAPRHEAARSVVSIDHRHIPPLLLLPPAVVKVVRVDALVPVHRVGYIPGAGDELPGILRQLGMEVTLLDETALAGADLSRFEAIVTGVRAYNTRPDLVAAQSRLLDFVAGGGTLVVQYNTDRGLVTDRLGPFPFKLSRDRVTDETAAIHLLLPDHALFSTPNRITSTDFAGWVQERGLYFASSWDPAFAAPLGMADPGEKESAGALLVARHGKGTYVYTGLAFFRQLPAGNPGAIRLFLNLLGPGRGRG
ncbi:MAG TPA: PIG-L family deacetylase [Thermoanaerobaculaceae bacterium]|nr:PIG-L family deacetylase [Thermoanaerobaculaceae bacterium]